VALLQLRRQLAAVAIGQPQIDQRHVVAVGRPLQRGLGVDRGLDLVAGVAEQLLKVVEQRRVVVDAENPRAHRFSTRLAWRSSRCSSSFAVSKGLTKTEGGGNDCAASG
jgi:hypothetical protein